MKRLESALILTILLALTWFTFEVLHVTIWATPSQSVSDHSREALPSRCRPFYNDGTDRWKDCMGVGYK